MATTKQKAAGWCGAGVAVCTAFLVTWEGFAPVAKHESVDPPGVITWCFGRTNYDDPTVKAGARFSKDECEQFLADDLPRYAEPLRKCIPTFDDMPPQRQAALVSFSYNLGPGTVCKSSVARGLNAGDVKAGCDAMLLYNKVNGHVCDDAHCGLGRRRRAEHELCLQQGKPTIEAAAPILPPLPQAAPKQELPQAVAPAKSWTQTMLEKIKSYFKKG